MASHVKSVHGTGGPADDLSLARIDGAGYTTGMSPTLGILIGLALLAVLAVLFMGLFSMARGGDFNRKYGNRLMRWRVGLQGLVLVLFALAMLTGLD